MMIEPFRLVPRPNHHPPSPTATVDGSGDDRNNNFAMMMLFPNLVNQPPPTAEEDDYCKFQNYCEDLRDRISVMKRLEETRYQPRDYLQQQQRRRTPQRHYEQQRRTLVEYLYRVVDYGNFQRGVVSYSMTHLLDRYLAAQAHQEKQHQPRTNGNNHCNNKKMSQSSKSTTTNTNSNKKGASNHKNNNALEDPSRYQLVALTCLYMAVKLFEPQKIGVDSLVPFANGMHTREQFLETELSVLQTLDWSVAGGPTPLAFVQLILPFVALSLVNNNSNNNNNNSNSHCPGSILTALYNDVQYQCELGVADYVVCCCAKPSDVAIAALWNGLENLVQGSLLSHQEQRAVHQCILRRCALLFQQHTTDNDDNVLQPQQLPLLWKCRLLNLQRRLRQLTMDAYSSNSSTTTATTKTTTCTTEYDSSAFVFC